MLADDWEIIPQSYNRKAGFGLKSVKTDQYVQDCNLMRFLQFSKEQDITIVGLKLDGRYIVGNDRSLYTEFMYKQWTYKYKVREENQIENKDLITGHKYRTMCGKEVIYLGFKYMSRIKNPKENFGEGYEQNITKIKKTYLISKNFIIILLL